MPRGKFPSIPAVRPENIADVVGKIKQWIDAANTERAQYLLAEEVAQAIDEAVEGFQPSDPTPDTPPTPSGLRASGAIKGVILTWDQPPYAKHAYFEVWRASSNAIGGATLLASPVAPIWFDNTAVPGETWYYWVRARATGGLYGPYNAVSGTAGGATRVGNVDLQPLAVQAANLADGAVDLQSGKVKSDGAFGALAVGYTVTRYLLATDGLLENLVVGNAQIANLDASKLTVGDGTIGGNLKSANYIANVSGWLVTPMGLLEANDVIIRGTVFATAGEFSAVVRMGAATSFDTGLGLWQGYDGANHVWRVGDPTGNKAQWDASAFAVYITGQAQPILSAGGINGGAGTVIINTAQFSLDSAGNVVMGGILAGAVGTFAGTLSAGTVTPTAFEAIVYEYVAAGTLSLTAPAKREGWAGLAVRITLQGGGGGGGGAYGTAAPNSNPIASGAGGGAGQRTVLTFEDVTAGEVLTLVVGARGAGGAASQTNSGGASAGNGTNGGNSTVTRAGVTYTATGGTGGKGGWRNGDGAHSSGFAVTPAGSLGGQAGYGRNIGTGATVDSEGGTLYTTNGANGGYGGSSQYGAGGAGGTFWYQGASSGGEGGRGAGGGGGGVDAQHPDRCYTGNGNQGGVGYILVEFYDPFSVVTNKRYSRLVEWLDTKGMGTVPTNAR